MEQLLLFNFSKEDKQTIRHAASALHIRCRAVDSIEYDMTLGALAEGRTLTKNSGNTAASDSGALPKSLILLCGLSDARMDRLLAALQKTGVQVDYKAALTPTNQSWNVRKLLLELHREQAVYSRGNS